MKTKFIFFLLVVGFISPLKAQNQIGSIAAAAFKNMEDENYEAATKNFSVLISTNHYSDLDKLKKNEKITRLKALAVFHYNNAKALAFLGKYDEGLANIEAIEKTTEKPEFFTFLKSIYKDRFFDNSMSFDSFDDYYKAFDDFPNIAYDVAPILRYRGQYSKALEIYTKALKKDKSPDNYYNAGLIYKLMGKEKEAKKLFEKGLAAFPTKKSPDNCSYQSIQILLQYELGQSEKARQLAKDILQNNAIDFCAINNLAKLKFLTKNYEEAIADYQDLVTQTPYYENGFLSIIQSYDRLGQKDRALTMLDDLLKLYPNYAAALTERASILVQKERIDQAKVDIDLANKLMPNHPMIQKMHIEISALNK